MDIIEVDWISDRKQLLGGQVSGIGVIGDFYIGIWLSYLRINFSDKSIITDMKTKVGVIYKFSLSKNDFFSQILPHS
ncbi:hypothetical protein NIES3974_33660 [Calothrix sp. NIES-3974]|nr:hypothetical protein NIES3974_33660 [Calothrix sp. NIES-3974]